METEHPDTPLILTCSSSHPPILPGVLTPSVRILVVAGGDLVIPSFLAHFLASLLPSGIYQSGLWMRPLLHGL